MAIREYLPRLTNFYIADGTGNLIDSVGGIDFAEKGVVGLNSADGPPPEPLGTSRGPCTSTTTGFFYTPSSDAWDFRNIATPTGVKERTLCGWYRFDTLTADQEVFGHWNGTAASNGYIWRYENAFSKMIVHLNGVTNNVDLGVGPTITAGEWNFGGFSTDGADVWLHSNGTSSNAETAFGGFANTDGAQATRIGHTLGSVSSSGIDGDIAYVMLFDYMFDDEDWAWFWNMTNGQLYPNGFTRPQSSFEHIHRIRRLFARGLRR